MYDRGGGFELSLEFHTGLQQAVGTHFGSSSSFSTTSYTTSQAQAVDISTTKVTIEPVNNEAVANPEVMEEHPIIHCMSHSQGTLWSIAALYPNAYDDDQPSSDATSSTTTATTTTTTTTPVHKEDDRQRRAALFQQPIVRGSDDVSHTSLLFYTYYTHLSHVYITYQYTILYIPVSMLVLATGCSLPRTALIRQHAQRAVPDSHRPTGLGMCTLLMYPGYMTILCIHASNTHIQCVSTIICT